VIAETDGPADPEPGPAVADHQRQGRRSKESSSVIRIGEKRSRADSKIAWLGVMPRRRSALRGEVEQDVPLS